MDIPLLNREDVESEGGDIEVSIREEMIEFLKSKGYKYIPSGEHLEETEYFFTKDGQFVQVIVKDEIPEEILELMEKNKE